MEQPRDPFADVAELRIGFAHFSSDVREVKQDLRRLDDRIFQVLLVQLATLATALGSLVTALIAVTR